MSSSRSPRTPSRGVVGDRDCAHHVGVVELSSSLITIVVTTLLSYLAGSKSVSVRPSDLQWQIPLWTLVATASSSSKKSPKTTNATQFGQNKIGFMVRGLSRDEANFILPKLVIYFYAKYSQIM